MPEIILIAHNIRSTHNVGAIFRSAEGFGVKKIILSGYTPAPHHVNDTRLPHIARKIHAQIHKTALGAEMMVPFECHEKPPLSSLKESGFKVIALEQTGASIPLHNYTSPQKIALILGEEVNGVSSDLLAQCSASIEIPMKGQKESFNVSVAAGIAVYGLLYSNRILA